MRAELYPGGVQFGADITTESEEELDNLLELCGDPEWIPPGRGRSKRGGRGRGRGRGQGRAKRPVAKGPGRPKKGRGRGHPVEPAPNPSSSSRDDDDDDDDDDARGRQGFDARTTGYTAAMAIRARKYRMLGSNNGRVPIRPSPAHQSSSASSELGNNSCF